MATPSSSSTAPRAAAIGGGGGGSNSNSNSNSNREGAAKVAVAEQISQAVQSTSNLLHLMQQSSTQAQLIQLPKNLLAKTPTIKNTGQVLEQLPRVISLLDAYVESGLESIPHLKTVLQLLANMESCQLNSLSQAQPTPEEHDRADQPSVEG